MSESAERLTFINPANGHIFGQAPIDTPETVGQAMAAMRAAFPQWSSKPVSERIAALRKLQHTLIARADEITEVINQDCGKTRQDALIEVFVTVDMLDAYLRRGAGWLKRRRVSSGLYYFKRSYVEPRPYGVTAVISPWNYPFALAMPPVVGALLAGNTVVLKPSEVTAATGALMQRLFESVPELSPYVRVVHGDGRTGAALVHSKPDYIFLTGSTATGRKVAQAAAETLTPLSCELGGKDAMIVLEDADLPAAARWGVWGAFFNAGQTCMGVERVYVHRNVYDRFVALALEETAKLCMGYSPDPINTIDLGPISDPRQVKIIQRHLDDAIAQGARILSGGRVEGSFIEPTILVDVTHNMLLMREETFGPLMPIVKVQDEEEAVALANDCEFGLGASIWSRNVSHAWETARRVEASSMIINDTIAQFAMPMLPFGGVKNSGYGRVHGKEGVMQFTRPYAYAVGGPPLPFDVATIMRSPGNYTLGKTIMQVLRGASLEQRLEPLEAALKTAGQKAPRVNRKALALGALGLAALGAVVKKKRG